MVNYVPTLPRQHSYPRLLVKFILLCAPLFTLSAMAQGVSVLMQHGDLQRTGWNQQETALTVANVNMNTFGRAYSVPVDDQQYAQPLVVSGLAIGGGTHNVVYAATVNNTVYAIDADQPVIYWSKNYSVAGQRAPKNSDMTGACGGNGHYLDFSGNMGIVGTPVVDPATQTLYFVARSTDGTSFSQHLHAVDLATGAERAGSPQLITATYPGSGAGAAGGVLAFDAQRQNQRCGLLLLNGIVYIAYASHCDWGPYHGWVLGYDASTLAQKVVYNDTPDGYNGGIWMSGAAPSADEFGNLYLSTGNGSAGANGDFNNVRNRSESVLKLTPSTTSTALAVSSFFTPSNYQALEDADLDLGSSEVMLVPNTNLALTGCKDGNIYVLNRDNMGGFNATTNQAVQTIALGSNKTLRSSYAYYRDANNKEFFYTWSANALLKAFPFNRAAGLFDVGSVVNATAQGPTGSAGAMMAVSSNGATPGTGVLWASHSFGDSPNQSTRPGILRAFDAANVTKELWNTSQVPADNIVGFPKYVCPTVANGKVYMATFSNQLIVYGAHSPPPQTCNATTNVALNKPAVASSSGSPGTPPSAAFDNNFTTRWASVQGVDPQWLYVDLQGQYNFCRVDLTWENAYGKDYQIQVSDDAQTWKTISTVTSNLTLTNSLQLQGTGRYVRLFATAHGPTVAGYSLYEFQVFGGPVNAPPACAPPANPTATGVSRTGATLAWAAVPSASSYNVAYKAVSAAAYTTLAAATNSLALTALSCGTDYFYKVQAVCSATATGAFSGDQAFSTSLCDASCGILPTRWFTQDVGPVGIPGQACYNNGKYRIRASGADIWNTVDGFRYTYKTFNGDGQIVARVDSLDNVNAWNKAGVMFRETVDGNSRHAFMALTSGNGAAFQYRLATGGTSFNKNLTGIRAPYYVKLIKRGTRYAGYISPDSLVWKQIGTTVDLGFGGGPTTAGIVLTSHANDRLSKAVLSHVPIILSADTTVGNPTSICPTGNLALNRPGACSSILNQTNNYEEYRAFDGNATTGWASAVSTAPQWLHVDLGKRYTICQVRVKWAAALAQAFEIQTSNDAQNWTALATIVGNQSSFNTIAVNGTGRFIRVYATVPATSAGYSINELEVSGTPVPNQLPNIALGKPAVASTTESLTITPTSGAFDNSGTTRWASAQGIDPSWLQVDLGGSYQISQVVLDWETALGRDFQIQLSSDATTWVTATSVTSNTLYSNVMSITGTGRYVRMLGLKRGILAGYSLFEMEVYGTPVAAISSSIAPKTALKTALLAGSEEITLHPNPATNSVTVTLPLAQAEEITVRDISGRLVRQLDGIAGQQQVIIPLNNLPPGMYTVFIRNRSQLYVKRLVKFQE